jgi:excisionase family DNA binding protein
VPDPDITPVISVTHAARILGISRSRAYESVRDGIIPSVRLSERRVAVPVAAFRRYLGVDA